MKKIGSYNGIITEISSSISKNGVPFTNLCLQVGQELLPMVAFAEVSTAMAHIGPGVQISVAGSVMDDGVIRINFFNAPNISHQAGPRKIKWEYHPDTLKLEWIMDVLTPEYVTRRMREMFKWEEIPTLPKSEKFKDGSYKKLIDELTVEAEFSLGLKEKKWEDNSTSQTKIEDESSYSQKK